ncbi:MAG: Unknown protein [uncultured Sulfurovum sp.]|uniref:SPOR domain-containing protein n=1 Tax=uncultured Sulfurovum sp. TaxID=269237 RepID=A0A6S6SLT9_9BACT|nr:MAG: Unknown protein [uncultured Sulfurovum sp.]
MKKVLLFTSMVVLFVGCETGVKNKEVSNEPVLSGIVDRTDLGTQRLPSVINKSEQKANGTSSNKIFSKSAQPGFYLQMAVFAKNKPTKAFLKPLDSSIFPYIVLNKYNKDYVLIGAYKSYNEAKSKAPSVKARLGKQTFVVQVLRP